MKICSCKMSKLNGRKKRDAKNNGNSFIPEYTIWSGIRTRCQRNSGRTDYHSIKISEEWAESFDKFIRDMGYRPSLKHSVDRKDNSRGYRKHNCRWALPWEQARNRNCVKDKSLPAGVYRRSSGRFSARITVLGRELHLGTFLTAEEAGKDYLKFKEFIFGEEL